jgi:hypothetical protein
MERLVERLAPARQALGTDDRSLRSRFRTEPRLKALWKAAQAYLRQQEGVESGSPKSVVRACYQGGLLSEEQARAAMEATEDRNLSVHTYNEQLAEAIFARIPGHARLMENWLTAMEQRLADQRQS